MRRRRHRITIKQVTAGGGEAARTFNNLVTDLPAEVEATRGREQLRGRQIEASVDYVVNIRHRTDVEPNMQITVDGGLLSSRTLEIVDVVDIFDHGHPPELDLHCRQQR